VRGLVPKTVTSGHDTLKSVSTKRKHCLTTYFQGDLLNQVNPGFFYLFRKSLVQNSVFALHRQSVL
jgi:hypothetical protein